MTCTCRIHEDGLVLSICDAHAAAAWHHEYHLRCQLDAELDSVVRELAGRSPTRIERKAGATGTFAIARAARPTNGAAP